jgi:hypothetical protein
LPKCTVGQAEIRLVEVYVVEGVVKLGAELQRKSFFKFGCFQNGRVGIEIPGSTEDILSRVSKGSYGIGLECCGVKPCIDQSSV